MKKIISLFALTLGLTVGHAQLYTSFSNQAATNVVEITTPVVLENITLFSTNTVPTLVYLYDGAITFVQAAYTNFVQYSTNVVTIYTNTTGTTNTFTNTVLYTQANVQAAATNNTVPVASIVVPASGGVAYYANPTIFARNLTLSNNLAGLSAVISYRKP